MSYVRHYAPDNASLVIRLALEQVGAPYRCALVDRRQAAQRSNAYMALKLNGLIPTLETDQGPIFETGAILLWLANRHGGVGPAPDSAERADFLTWLFFLSNTVHSALLMLFYPEQFIGADPIHQSTLRANAANALVRYHTQLNGLVAHGHTWCGGQKPRALDFYIAATLHWPAICPRDYDRSWHSMANCPALHDMCQRLETLAPVYSLIQAEGMNANPFTKPAAPNAPEGSPI
jgi:glutathione S-transferase